MSNVYAALPSSSLIEPMMRVEGFIIPGLILFGVLYACYRAFKRPRYLYSNEELKFLKAINTPARTYKTPSILWAQLAQLEDLTAKVKEPCRLPLNYLQERILALYAKDPQDSFSTAGSIKISLYSIIGLTENLITLQDEHDAAAQQARQLYLQNLGKFQAEIYDMISCVNRRAITQIEAYDELNRGSEWSDFKKLD